MNNTNSSERKNQENSTASSTKFLFPLATRLAKQHGLYLFPVAANAKTPAIKNWQAAATTDPAQLEKWFKAGRYNIGIATGPSALIVIDTDVKGGVDGEAKLIALVDGDPIRQWELDHTLTIDTPSGGRHRYFRTTAAIHNSVRKIAPGVDIRASGGCVLAPGSVINGKPYIVVSNVEIADAPEWLLDLIEAANAKAEVRKAPDGIELDTLAAVATARDYLLTEAPLAIEGSGGNDTTYRVAASVRDFGIGEDMAVELMLAHWNSRCSPPWSDEEITVPVANAFRYAQNAPACDAIDAQFDVLDAATVDKIGGPANDNSSPGTTAGSRAAARVVAAPFVWRDPALIPPREWLYGRHYIRGYATGTVAPGGTGKTSLTLTEALSMATGCDLIGGNESDVPRKVWLWNLEDPAEEIERRVAAAVQHHGVNPVALDGRLFVNSGRDTPLVIAKKIRETVTVLEPVVSNLTDEIRANGIDVLIVDPFVSSHRLPENDNAAMDAAVKAWARVAHFGHCAVELVHHSRKLGGEAVSAESARGGSAFVDGCRGVRVINRMAEDDASKLGITEPRRFFYVADDKPNMAPPPAGKRDWYQLVSVHLPNGDDVGAVDRYTPPDPLDDVTPTDLERIQKRFAEGGHRYDEQSSEWGGYGVAEILGIDVGVGGKAGRTPEQNAARAKVKDILRKLLAAGDIRVEQGKDAQRKTRNFYASGEIATAGQDRLAA